MKTRIVGPLGKVTGSCAWLRDHEKGWSFLVDCGMQQEEVGAKHWNGGNLWPFNPSEIQFVVLTHAHVDHSGLIPELYRQGFTGEVYCTRATRRIAEVLLRDAARFGDTQYTQEDVERIRWNDTRLKHGCPSPVATDLFVRIFRNGHILGSVSAAIIWGPPKDPSQRSIVFSGDVGPGAEDRESLPLLRFPQNPSTSNYAVLESTYGDVIRPDEVRDPVRRRADLAALLDQIIETGGTLAIPAFSVGRTQDVMFDLSHLVAEHPERFAEVSFLLDSPTAAQINKITLDELRDTCVAGPTGKIRPLWLGKQLFRALGLERNRRDHFDTALEICRMTLSCNGTRIGTIHHGNEIAKRWAPIFSPVTDRESALEAGHCPRVIVMSSGSCDGGPAATWLPALLKSSANIVAMSGYCSPASMGGELLKIGSIPPRERDLHTAKVTWTDLNGAQQATVEARDIKAAITKLSGYSAHADQYDLVEWCFPGAEGGGRRPVSGHVLLNHGNDRARNALHSALRARASELGMALKVECPDEASAWIDLESDQCVEPRKSASDEEIEEEIERLRAMLGKRRAA
ncbi:MAG: MBL fold metallo-hydrolase [Azoarcus sp.]|nr:MAG: MBL fold metallo-hydrolase [Azoarcus sp.]